MDTTQRRCLVWNKEWQGLDTGDGIGSEKKGGGVLTARSCREKKSFHEFWAKQKALACSLGLSPFGWENCCSIGTHAGLGGLLHGFFSMRQCAQQTPQQWLGRAEEDGPEVGYIEKEGCFAPKDKEGGRGDPMENYREGASVRPSFFP